MASQNSCVINLPKTELVSEDPNCKKVSASGSYETADLGTEVTAYTEVLSSNFTLDNVYAVFNGTAQISFKCDGVEVFRILTSPGQTSVPVPVDCIRCKSGDTFEITVCGPCESDFFICVNGRLL